MTNAPDPQTSTTFVVQPRFVPGDDQQTVYVNTFVAAAAQGTVHIDFGTMSPMMVPPVNTEAAKSGAIDFPIKPVVRLALSVEAARLLVQVLSTQIGRPVGFEAEVVTSPALQPSGS